MVKCSLVIRCYNESRYIDRLLRGIFCQSYATSNGLEVVVVDSGSTDGTVEIASRYPIKLLSIRKEDFSFGRALNQGIAMATGELIVIASAHVYPVYDDWLATLLMPFSDPRVALSYGKQCGNETTKYSEHQIFARWFQEASDLDQLYPFCNNANAAIRRSLWQEIPYDEALTGLEDLDWAKKVQKLGFKIAYVAEAPIVHVHDETPKRIQNRYYREALALKQICPNEHFDLWDFCRLLVGNVVSDAYHAWCDGLFFRKLGEICMFRLMQFWGTYRGFRYHGKVTRQLRETFYYPKGFNRTSQVEFSPKRRPIDYGPQSINGLEEKILEKVD